MTEKELSISLGRNVDDWYNYIFQYFQSRYECFESQDGEIWFKYNHGAFHICDFEDLIYGFIIEYAEGTSEKAMGMAIDGNQWPLLDYDSPEIMLKAMLKEIEGWPWEQRQTD